MQQLPVIEKTDSQEEKSRLKQFSDGIKYKGGRKVCVHFKTDTDKLNFVL